MAHKRGDLVSIQNSLEQGECNFLHLFIYVQVLYTVVIELSCCCFAYGIRKFVLIIDFLITLMTYIKSDVWIGLTDSRNEMEFLWSDQQDLTY